ncbi:MAG: glycosyltransferase family 4 protein [Pyrinomonadaceae bacterium]
MRRLIFCWNYLEWGGAQIYFLGIMKLARQNWDVTVLLPRGSDPKLLGFLDEESIAYEFLDVTALLGTASTISEKFRRHLSHIRSWIEIAKRVGAHELSKSILHIEVAPWHAVWFLMFLSLRRANVFITLHNALPEVSPIRRFIWRYKLAIFSRLRGMHIFTSNEDAKARFRPWVTEKFWNTIKVTYTTVNPAEIARATDNTEPQNILRSKFDLDPTKFTVLCLGQFIDRKGRWVFLEAARLASKSAADIQFVWLTASPVAGEDIDLIETYGLGERFHLIQAGRVGHKRQDILEFYRLADVYALPSFVEGLPIALLEAMAMGVASISTDVYAIPEALMNEKTGLLVRAGNAEQLAKAIVRLKNNDGLRRELAGAGREFVLEHFDERAASQIAIDAYGECLANV